MNSADTFDGADEVRRAWMAGLAPDPSLTVSQWADRHRVLSSRAASEAGPYRTARTPYMKAVMDALSPRHPAQRVVFMKAAEVEAREAGNNCIGFCMHCAPREGRRCGNRSGSISLETPGRLPLSTSA